MKKILICLIGLIFVIGCSSERKELYKHTDAFVESLETTYESYGIFSAKEHSVTTSDGLYRISPVGRLINVRYEKYVSEEEYEDLCDDLARRYKNDHRVDKVYVCNGGTVMIDCRN